MIKVETHNHPTAISPFPGAATGAGGEIRDEGATGRGAKPKAGLAGFSVSHLRIPGCEQPWEGDAHYPRRIATALEIMLDGPIGAASFNNEFGRPNILGYFRTFEQAEPGSDGVTRGYHKPIMIAGGLGNVLPEHVEKAPFAAGAPVVVLGGPALRIGLGGGAASSMASGSSSAELDFASVQRGNPEMERRAQEVIDRCWMRGAANPILSIHDVGAGGLSNAVPELLHQSERGGLLDLRAVPNDEPGMSPAELWCNEAQERYVLALDPQRLAEFEAICRRERCPFAVIGVATDDDRLRVRDTVLGEDPVDLPMSVLLGKPPRTQRDVTHVAPAPRPFDPGAHRYRRSGPARAAHAGGGRQDFSRHHRRSQRRRSDRARSDGGAVAGARERRGRDRGRLRRLHRRGDGHGRAHAARAHRSGRVGAHGGRRSAHQHPRRGHRRRRARCGCRRTGWRRADIPAKTPPCTTPCARSAKHCAPRSASPFRSARIRCP